MTARFKTMGPNCTCEGEPTCISYSDDYATDKLATDYTTVSGSWSVSGGKLTTSSTSAILIVNANANVSGGVIEISVDSLGTSIRRKIRLYGAYTDANNCLFAEVDLDASALPFGEVSGHIKLYERSGGTDTLLEEASQTSTLYSGSIVLSGTLIFRLCWHAGNVSAGIGELVGGDDNGTGWRVTGQHSQTGFSAGIGTGSSATNISLDNLVFANNRYDLPACGTTCTSCRDVCEDGLSATLDVTIPASMFTDDLCSNCASAINNQTFTLNLQTETCAEIQGISVGHIPCLYRYYSNSIFTSGCNRQLEIIAYFGVNTTSPVYNTLSVELRIWSGMGAFTCITGGAIGSDGYALWKLTGMSLQQTCAGASWTLPFITEVGFNAGGGCVVSGTPGSVGVAA